MKKYGRTPGIYKVSTHQKKGEKWKVIATRQIAGRQVKKTRTVYGSYLAAQKTKEALKKELQSLSALPMIKAPESFPTLNDYAQFWMSSKRASLRVKTVEMYAHVLKSQLLPVMGDMPCDEITRLHLKAYSMFLEQKRRTTCKGESIPYAQDTLRGFWRVSLQLLRDMAADLELSDMTQRLKGPSSKRQGVRERTTLTEKELSKLLFTVKASFPWVYLEVLTMALTGLRAGEVYALTFSDVITTPDNAGYTLRVSKSAVHTQRGWQLTETKTKNERLIPISDYLAEKIEEKKRALGLIGEHRGLIFPSNRGGFRHVSSLSKPLFRASKAAGLTISVTPQVLRRTFNTLIKKRAVGSDLALRDMMGHVSSDMTSLYFRSNDEEKRAIVLDFCGAIGSRGTP